jgi:glycopeptide antibiotics resistance protein
VSASIELLQLAEMFFDIAFNRATDIDDIILNVAGVYIGFLLFRLAGTAILKRLANVECRV